MNQPPPQPLPDPPQRRSPDDADLALARVATPWVGRWLRTAHRNNELAQALTAWLAARGIY